MKKSFAITLFMFLGGAFAHAQDYILVHSKENIKKYEISTESTVEFKEDEAPTVVYNQDHSVFIAEGGKEVFSEADLEDPGPSAEIDKDILRCLDNYALDMLIQYSHQSNNILVSPLSATMLYSMVSNFTDQETMTNILNCMGLEQFTIEQVNKCCLRLNSKLRDVTQYSQDYYQNKPGRFIMENNMWLQKNDTIYNSFLKVADAYNVNVRGIDSMTAEDIISEAQDINILLEDGTYNLERPSWDNVSSIVTSSMDFQYAWGASAYVSGNDDNNHVTFDNVEVEQGDVFFEAFTFDTSEDPLPFVISNKFDILEMEYNRNGNERFSTYVFLPHEDVSLEECLTEVRRLGIDRCLDEVRIQKDSSGHIFSMDIAIPKFKMEGVWGLNSSNDDIPFDARQFFLTDIPEASPSNKKFKLIMINLLN